MATAKKTMLALAALLAMLAGAGRAQTPETSDVNVATSPGTKTAQADWKGVRPGHSTRAQVESLLGSPAKVQTREDGRLEYIYPPKAFLGFNRVIFSLSGVVETVGIGMFPEDERPRFSALVERHGAPDQLSKRSLRDYEAEQGIYRFPEGVGLWVVASEATDTVFGATYYDPATEPDIPVPEKPLPK